VDGIWGSKKVVAYVDVFVDIEGRFSRRAGWQYLASSR